VKKQTYMGQKIHYQTVLFGKRYFWMEDGEGTIYLAKAKPEYGVSVGADGTKTKVLEGFVPDFS